MKTRVRSGIWAEDSPQRWCACGQRKQPLSRTCRACFEQKWFVARWWCACGTRKEIRAKTCRACYFRAVRNPMPLKTRAQVAAAFEAYWAEAA